MVKLFRFVSGVGGLLVAVLIAITAASDVARYVFAQPIQWTEEASGLLMIWIVFIGAIGCEIEDSHLKIDAVTAAFGPALRRWVEVAVGAVSVGLLGYMAWLGYQLAEGAAMRHTQILKISFWWLDIAVALGAGVLAVLGIVRVVGLVRGRRELLDTGDLRLTSSRTKDL